MAKTKYHFKIRDGIGIDPQGNPEPAVAVGIAISYPTIRDGEPINVEQRVQVNPLPDSRIFVTDDALVADGLRGLPTLQEIDEPDKATVAASVKDTKASREAAGGHVDPEEAEAAEPPAPTTTNPQEA